MNLGLKSLPKLNRHNDKCVLKVSDENTQGVRRSKSQTESEENSFPKTKRLSLIFFLVCSFCDSFMDVPFYLGPNNI